MDFEDEDEDDQDEVSSTVSNLSELSGLSNISGQDWKGIAGQLLIVNMPVSMWLKTNVWNQSGQLQEFFFLNSVSTW